VFHVVAGLLAVYVIVRVVYPLPCARAVKLLLGLVVVLAAEHHLITRTFFGTMASPEVPFAVLVVAGWGFGALILMSLMMLVRDAIGVAIYLFSRERGRAWFSGHGARIVIVALAAVLAGVGVRESVRVPDVKTVEMTLPGWPHSLDGYRLVQLTDLHASRLLQAPWIASVVDRSNALNPDLIVITGDLVDGTPQARARDVEPLGRLRAREGVIAVAGNHEYYAQYSEWMTALQQLGMRLLHNEHVIVGRDGGNFVVAGVSDMIASRYGEPLPDIVQALADAPADLPTIVLSHRPAGAQANAAAGADLQLSGHTHGGQAWGMHWLVQAMNDGFVSGLYQVDAMRLYVSNGAGLWPGFPIRLGQRSEITQFILRADMR